VDNLWLATPPGKPAPALRIGQVHGQGFGHAAQHGAGRDLTAGNPA
jgi:hypothetical protein